MYPLTHILAGLILVILLKLLSPLAPIQILIIFLSSVLIDVDHWLIYAFKKKNISISKAYFWFLSLQKSKKKPVFLYVFHTVEFFLLVALLSAKFQFFQLILTGMAFHMVFDIISAIKDREYLKQVSLIYCILNRK